MWGVERGKMSLSLLQLYFFSRLPTFFHDEKNSAMTMFRLGGRNKVQKETLEYIFGKETLGERERASLARRLSRSTSRWNGRWRECFGLELSRPSNQCSARWTYSCMQALPFTYSASFCLSPFLATVCHTHNTNPSTPTTLPARPFWALIKKLDPGTYTKNWKERKCSNQKKLTSHKRWESHWRMIKMRRK